MINIKLSVLQEKYMQQNIVFSNEFVSITRRQDGFYIESYKKGMTLEQFNVLINDYPQIKISGVMTVRNALVNAPRPPEKFAEVKERITVDISDDELRAFITLCVEEDEFSGAGKANLFKEIIRKLNEKRVTFGIKNSVLLGNLCNNKQILVAEGIPPADGKDSVIKMYELTEAKPEVKEDGNVDHYELNLINRVNIGDWLGERHDPTMGTPGKTVKGNTILCAKGNMLPIFYDPSTVREEYSNGVTTLYAKINGAVHYDGDRVSISNHLEITSNVDFKTGNIDFDGFLTVKGSIEDSFSVEASRDIEILGDFGLGSVKDIISREGSIFIKGGIAGKNKSVIRSRKNIFTKFVSDTTLICDGSVHIGFYCLNSNIRAKEVIMDSPKSQIIGGNIEADIKVTASIIGSSSEKRTIIKVNGFDRKALKESVEKLIVEIECYKEELAKAKQEVSVYSSTSGLSKDQIIAYEIIKNRYFEIRDRLKILEDERKALTGYLKTAGEGEISVLKRVYPNTLIEIKGKGKEVNKEQLGTRFYIQDGVLKEQ